MQAILPGENCRYQMDAGLVSRCINLITGLELLSIGTAFHDFKKCGSDTPSGIEAAGVEKAYTLDLLFGDIFYSRAVIYLLKFKDHKVFEDILGALKRLHESRLKLHLAIQEVLKSNSGPDIIDRDRHLLKDANRLFYIAFRIGERFPEYKGNIKSAASRSSIVDSLLMYKTYYEISEHMVFYSDMPSSQLLIDHLKKAKEYALQHLEGLLSALDDENFRDSVKIILQSLQRN